MSYFFSRGEHEIWKKVLYQIIVSGKVLTADGIRRME